MKKLSRASAMTFRTFCETFLRSGARELQEKLGLSFIQTQQLSGDEIAVLAERSRLLRRIGGIFHLEEN